MTPKEGSTDSKEWYYKDYQYRTYGPFSAEEMKTLLSTGGIDEHSPVKSAKMTGYSSLKNTYIYTYLTGTSEASFNEVISGDIQNELSGEIIPPLSVVFFVLSGLGLLGGMVLCFWLWPGEPALGYGWKPIAYVSSITWLIAGIIESAIFAAIGQGLIYLKTLVEYTKKQYSKAGHPSTAQPEEQKKDVPTIEKDQPMPRT